MAGRVIAHFNRELSMTLNNSPACLSKLDKDKEGENYETYYIFTMHRERNAGVNRCGRASR
jgi:hypothetical protein